MLFTKTNHTLYPDALIREANGLQRLKQAVDRQPDNPLRIPDVITVSEHQLVITHIRSQSGSREQSKLLGRGLAMLHKEQQFFYGLNKNNYIGLNPQHNTPGSDWGAFFIQQRLRYQVSRIQDENIRRRYIDILESNRGRLATFLNTHCQHPSLVHGDLWNGNVLFDQQHAWLIDPAVYYGDREVDLAMTEMFGGFSELFYASYDEIYPRTDAYPLKRTIYNLYHYLNHYNLFGSGYLGGCEQGWKAIEDISAWLP